MHICYYREISYLISIFVLLTRRRLTLPEGTIFIAHLANGIDNYQTALLNYPAITWGR